MKTRYVYLLLFSLPALLAAIVTAFLLSGAVAGGLWLFVFGDERWPHPAETALALVFLLGFAVSWISLLCVAYAFGRKQERAGIEVARHYGVAAGATALLLVLVVSYQWGVGNIGSKSDSILCAEFCKRKEFTSSGMPPRNTGAATCSCFDAQGRAALTVPMREVAAAPRTPRRRPARAR